MPIDIFQNKTVANYSNQIKITEEYVDFPVDFIEVRSANYFGDFAIRVFSVINLTNCFS